MMFLPSLLTALLASTALAAPSLPPLQSNQLRRVLYRSELKKHAEALEEQAKLSNGTRAFGTKAHNATVSYIKEKLDATGYYDVELQTFVYLFSEGTAEFDAAGKDYATQWFTYGPAGEVTAPMVVVPNLGCETSDFAGGVSGKIALIKRGTCEFGLKVANAGAAGAAGAIIYNNADGPVGGGTLGQPSRPSVGPYVPAGSVSGVDGAALVAAVGAGEVVGHITVDATNEDRYTSNVLAFSKGGDRNNVVFSGGHTDSVPAGPGVNDDGSGAMAILEIALRASKFSTKNALAFGFWTAEEYGLVGSDHYVTGLTPEERAKIAVYLNFDMIASPNYGYFLYDGDGSAFNLTGPAGSDHIEHLFEDYFEEVGLITAPTAFDGRSDYGPFLDAGIPSGGLFTGAEGIMTEEQAGWWNGKAGVAYDINYHQKGDDLANLNYDAWIQNTKAAAHAIATYAQSLEGIPRGLNANRASVSRKKASHAERRHFACTHEIFET